MVKVIAENGEFKVEGTFDMGYIGLFKDSQMEIMTTYAEPREWQCVTEALDTESCTDEDIAACLTEHLNELEKRVQANIKHINDEFLYRIYDMMTGCSNEFWDHEELTVKEFMPEDEDIDIYDDIIAADEEHLGYCEEEPNDGSVEKPDVEAFIRKYMPMFNLDNFINGIVPEGLCFGDGSFSFQCSDKFDYALACSAYDEIEEEDLSFTDWHNF